METTFISIHDLSLDARVLYVSTSVEDILGYAAHEIVGKSCWEYFHPDEIPFAQAIHGRSIRLDKAAVLNYCQIKAKQGHWVGCECVFTIVHDCLVASTSIYKTGNRSQRRAKAAPVIRQLFSSSPRDPRYHMLQYISSKFSVPNKPVAHEPRAALFLNRFSRTLSIMYATDGLADLLQIRNDELIGKSFYYCIEENCLREAVQCLESAKANDSIAYLRFWFRDPRQDDLYGDCLTENRPYDPSCNRQGDHDMSSTEALLRPPSPNPDSRSSSNNSNEEVTIFDRSDGSPSSSISSPEHSPSPSHRPAHTIELEAVVSCTSDGLVVVLRGARPFVPALTGSLKHPYANGLFASPWANNPIMPSAKMTFTPSSPESPKRELAQQDFMQSIREVVAFAWSLTGINGSLADYGRGVPLGEAQPHPLMVWQPNGQDSEDAEHQKSGMQHPETRTCGLVCGPDLGNTVMQEDRRVLHANVKN